MVHFHTGTGVVSHLLFGQQYFNRNYALSSAWSEWFWAIGVVVTLLGSTLTVVGFMVQKRSHSTAEAKGSTSPYFLQTEWLMGTAIWLFGNFICWIALGLAPQAILASLNCWNIGITLVIAPALLGEPVSNWTAASATLLALGTGWVIACGPKQYQIQTVTSIFTAFSKTQSICAFIGTILFLLAMSTVGFVRWRSKATPVLSYVQHTTISAHFAWYATLLSKSAAKIFVSSVQLSRPMYEHPAIWAFVGGFTLCGVAQAHFLNMGLRNGDAVMVIPLYEALSMTGQLVIGGLVFDEFMHFSYQELAWFWAGVLVVMMGIISLAWEARSKTKTLGGVGEKTPLMIRYNEDAEVPLDNSAAKLLYK